MILCTFRVFVSSVGVVSGYIYTFCFRVVTYRHKFISLDLIEFCWFLTSCASQSGLVLQCVKRKSPLLYSYYSSPPMLKYYCSTNHTSCFPTMCVTLLPLSISNISSKSHWKCFAWVLQLGKSFLTNSFCPPLLSEKKKCAEIVVLGRNVNKL